MYNIATTFISFIQGLKPIFEYRSKPLKTEINTETENKYQKPIPVIKTNIKIRKIQNRYSKQKR